MKKRDIVLPKVTGKVVRVLYLARYNVDRVAFIAEGKR